MHSEVPNFVELFKLASKKKERLTNRDAHTLHFVCTYIYIVRLVKRTCKSDEQSLRYLPVHSLGSFWIPIIWV
jgi:hypothetical protein